MIWGRLNHLTMKTSDLFLIYLLAVNAVAVIITVIDKINAKRKKRRISEDFLMTIGLLGGAIGEYITMKVIHHKTRHKKFMIGLPIEIIIQISAAVLIYIYK